MKYTVLLMLVSGPVAAQDYAIRATDRAPDITTLSQMILDRDVVYFDDGISRYNTDGSYSWTYSAANGGGVWSGTYVMTDNVICIVFDSGMDRCDMFVTSGDRLTLLTAEGDRYPIRDIN